MNPHVSTPVSALLLFALARPLAAEVVPDGAQIPHLVPESVDISPFIGRVVRGEFSGDLRTDVAMLAGTTVHVVGNPNTFHVYAPLDAHGELEANDLAVLPGATTYGLDLILTVGPKGLEGWEIGSNGEFSPRAIETDLWRGARRVRTGDLDGDGRLDVVGLSADGVTVRGLRDCGAGEFEPMLAWTVEGIEQIETVHWIDGDETRQLALMLEHELRVYDETGSVLETFTTVGPSVLFDVVRCRGEATDSIAWITRTPDLEHQWFCLLKPGGASEPGFALGLLGATGAGHGDVDLDGDDDVLLLHTYSPYFVLLANRTGDEGLGGPGTNHFGNTPEFAGAIQIGPLDTEMGHQRGQPAVADLDLDGDLDGLFPLQGARTLVLQRSGWLAESAHRFGIAYSPTNVVVTETGFLFRPDLEWPQDSPEDATHLELQVFRQPAGSAVETDPVYSGDVDLADFTPGVGTLPVEFEVVMSHAYAYPDLFLVARLVRRNPAGIDVRAWPDTVWEFTEYDYTGGGIQGRTPVPDLDPMDTGRLPPPPPGSPVPPP